MLTSESTGPLRNNLSEMEEDNEGKTNQLTEKVFQATMHTLAPVEITSETDQSIPQKNTYAFQT